MKDLSEIPEINPELFLWENYEPDYGGRLGLDFRESTSIWHVSKKLLEHCVGYCDATRLQVRPKTGMYALMCEDENHEKFWFHYPDTCFDGMRDRMSKMGQDGYYKHLEDIGHGPKD